MTYHANCRMAIRAYDCASFGLSRNVPEHEANFLERAGNLGLWFVEVLPGKMWRAAKDPRTVTAVATTVAALVDSYLFYPEETSDVLEWTWEHLPNGIGARELRFAGYLYTLNALVSYGARAEGRFWNSELMRRFYAGELNA